MISVDTTRALREPFRPSNFFCQIDANEGSTASHSRQVVGFDIASHSELRHDHGAERRGRRKERAVDDQYIDFSWLYVGLFQGLFNDVKNDSLGFFSAGFDRSVGLVVSGRIVWQGCQALSDSRWPGGGWTGARSIENPSQKVQTFLGEAALSLHDFHDLVLGALPIVGRLEGFETQHVNGRVASDHPGRNRQDQSGGLDGRRKDFESLGIDDRTVEAQ